MLASFVLGLLSAAVVVYRIQQRRGHRATNQKKRIEELERELDKTNRLLAATRKKM